MCSYSDYPHRTGTWVLFDLDRTVCSVVALLGNKSTETNLDNELHGYLGRMTSQLELGPAQLWTVGTYASGECIFSKTLEFSSGRFISINRSRDAKVQIFRFSCVEEVMWEA